MPLILPYKPWIVQKYGGTSLGKLLPTITRSIIPEYLKTHNVAVVCSAISGTTKSLGTTSLLLEAIKLVTAPRGNEVCELNHIVDIIQDQHLEASRILKLELEDGEISPFFLELDKGIIEDCEQVRGFLIAARVSWNSALLIS